MAVELIRLDTTIMMIDCLINEVGSCAEADALIEAKEGIYTQQRYTAGVQPVNRWICVDEALPNSGEAVLIYYNNQFYIAKYNGDFAETMPWSSSGHWWGKDLISFWQPLPKPPETTKG